MAEGKSEDKNQHVVAAHKALSAINFDQFLAAYTHVEDISTRLELLEQAYKIAKQYQHTDTIKRVAELTSKIYLSITPKESPISILEDYDTYVQRSQCERLIRILLALLGCYISC